MHLQDFQQELRTLQIKKKKLVKEKRGRALIPSPSNAYNVNKSIVGERSFSEMVTKQLLFMVML